MDAVPTPSFSTGRAGSYLRLQAGRAGLWCPKCSQFGLLDHHQIAADGTVSPSVECPVGCGFHEQVRLAGWGG